jgi:uncharacterized protein YjfI (DUF2170 family)
MPLSTVDITGIDKRTYYAMTGTISPDFEQPPKLVEILI